MESDPLWPKEPSEDSLGTTKGRILRGAIFSYAGVLGFAFVAFASRDDILELADWARWLVDHWREMTESVWIWLFGVIGLRIPSAYIPLLNCFVFVYSLLIGSKVFHTRISKSYATMLPLESWWYVVFSFISAGITAVFLISISYNTEMKDHPYGYMAAFIIWNVPYIFIAIATDGDRRVLRNLQYRTFCAAGFLIILLLLNYISLLDLDLTKPPS